MTVITKECCCGEEVELHSSWENECTNCGQLYNGAGQRILPFEEYAYDYWED